MSEDRNRIAELVREAGLSDTVFIDVVDGEKKSVDHEQHPPDGITGNYGIYATGADPLVILDIDDYKDLEDKSGHTALSRLPPTLEQGSPHGGTHRIYAVSPTDDGRLVAAALEAAFGKANLKASWGEVRTSNQYVVGAGSQLDGCEKDGCDECAEPDGGRYTLQADREIAEIDAEQLIDVLDTDPEIERVTEEPARTPERARKRTREDVDLSVYDVLSSAYSEGERVEHPLGASHSGGGRSDTGTNFMVDEGGETWRCWRHSCTGNALHLVGMEEGIIECGDWDSGPLGSDTWAEIFEAARERGLDVGDPPEQVDSTSDFSDLDEDEVARGEAILQSQTSPTDPVGELDYHNGGYGVYWEQRDDSGNVTNTGHDMVTNFTLETLSFLDTEEHRSSEFVVRVHPNHPTEQPYDVRVAPSVFNSPDKFRDEIVLGRTTWFDPSNRNRIRTVTLLRNLRETVGAQPAPHRKGQPFIGLSKDYTEFVTPEGSFTADGWSDDPEFEFYSKGGGADSGALGDKWLLDPEDDIDVDEDDVARICELLWQTRKHERGLPMVGWFYAAPIKALIHDWESEFPLLSPHGDTGTGKTATLETLCRAFGLTGEPITATDTRFTIQKHISESRGAPLWIDEYKPTEMSEGNRDHLHQRLKEVTKERTMSKGTPDLDMVQLHMRAPVVLSGEQKVSDPAVRRRTILTNLSREPTRDGTDTKAAFGELTGTAYEDADGNQYYPDGYDLRQHALAFYEWVLDHGVENIRDEWNAARERVKDVLADYGVTIEASEERGLQTVIFGVELYKSFAQAHGADAEELPREEHVREACLHVVENIGKGGQRREHADEFLELCALAASDGYLEPGVHHRLLDSQSHECEVLALHMPTVFSTVKRYVRDTNLEGEYNVLSKTDYLNSFSNKADAPGTYVLGTNQKTRHIENGTKAVHFDHEAITRKLGADFNVEAFRPAEEREANADAGDSGGDDDGDGGSPPEHPDPVAIGDIDPSKQDIASVIGVVEFGQYDGRSSQAGTPAWTATLQDRTGEAELVVWEQENIPQMYDSTGLFEPDALHVKGAETGEYDGKLQLVVGSDTTIESAQVGAGQTAGEIPDEDQGQLDSSSEPQAEADGGLPTAAEENAEEGESEPAEDSPELEQADVVPRAVMYVRDQGPDQQKGVPHAELVEHLVDEGATDGLAEWAIEKLLEKHEIHSPAEEGFYKPG